MADPVIAPKARQTAPPAPAEWRAAMGYFPTGVTVVTSWRDETPIGSTVNAFCSVSLEPPLLLVCLDVSNPICRPIIDSGVFGVNLLAEEGGGELARHFAKLPQMGYFDLIDFDVRDHGAPRLAAAPVFVDCAVESASPTGDHVIVVGRGLRIERGAGAKPLRYHAGRFITFGGEQ